MLEADGSRARGAAGRTGRWLMRDGGLLDQSEWRRREKWPNLRWMLKAALEHLLTVWMWSYCSVLQKSSITYQLDSINHHVITSRNGINWVVVEQNWHVGYSIQKMENFSPIIFFFFFSLCISFSIASITMSSSWLLFSSAIPQLLIPSSIFSFQTLQFSFLDVLFIFYVYLPWLYLTFCNMEYSYNVCFNIIVW